MAADARFSLNVFPNLTNSHLFTKPIPFASWSHLSL